MNRRGQMISEEVVGVIIAVAAAAGIIFLLIVLFAPGFNSVSETSKSYLGMVEDAIKVADDGGVGEFSLFDMSNSEVDTEFYLVYFGEKALLNNSEGKNFIRENSGVNAICVCPWKDGKGVCVSCTNLDIPAVFDAEKLGKINQWAIGAGKRVKIRREGDVNYVFEKF